MGLQEWPKEIQGRVARAIPEKCPFLGAVKLAGHRDGGNSTFSNDSEVAIEPRSEIDVRVIPSGVSGTIVWVGNQLQTALPEAVVPVTPIEHVLGISEVVAFSGMEKDQTGQGTHRVAISQWR
jgi:hypothetical protein